MFKSTDVLAYERVISLQVAVSRSTGLVLINANYQPQSHYPRKWLGCSRTTF
jgi:hypothetical protein